MKRTLLGFIVLTFTPYIAASCETPNCIDCATKGWSDRGFYITNYSHSASNNSLAKLSNENPFLSLDLSINHVDPKAEASSNFVQPRWYLSENIALPPYYWSGPLTYYGPIGAYGPLSSYGPIGASAWEPSDWTEVWEDVYGTFFSEFDFFADADGSLSIAGPLGPDGPYTTTAYCDTLPSINDFGKHLQAGGIWSVLGPAGPLGPIGPLGPLGPNGSAAQLYPPDSNGNFIDPKTAKIVSSINIVQNDGKTLYRTYPLYELYNASYALGRVNDMSWLATSGSISGSDHQVWQTQSAFDQTVSVVAIMNQASIYNLEHLSISITDKNTGLVITANQETSDLNPSIQYVNQVFFRATEGHNYSIAVSATEKNNKETISYRIIVTGSTEYLNKTDISGDHQTNISSTRYQASGHKPQSK